MDPNVLINEGYQLHIQNNSDEALDKYNEALKLTSYFPEIRARALYYRGLTYQQLRDKNKAIRNFSRAASILKNIVHKSPMDFNSKNYLGLVYLELHDFNKAEETFNEIIKNTSRNSFECANAFKGVGNYRYELKNYTEALNAYRKALKVYSNYVNIGINKSFTKELNKFSKCDVEFANTLKRIGNCHYWLQNYEEALDAYNRALKIYHNYVDVYFNKGVVFGALGRYKDSIECYEKALEINPNYYLAHNNKSYSLYDIYKFKDALKACNQCMETCNSYDNALSIKGIILLRLGCYEKAITAMNDAVKLYPSFDEAWYHKGSIHFFLDQFNEAQEAFNRVIALDKNFVSESWGYKGIIFAKNNNFVKAMECLSKGEEAVKKYINKDKRYQKCMPLILRKSFVFYLFGKYQEALDELNSIDITFTNNIIHVLTFFKLKGIVYEKLRNYNEIEKNFDETLSNIEKILFKLERAESYKANVYYEKGIIHRRHGQYEDSVKAFKEALKENSDHFYSMNELGIAYRKSGEPYKALKAFENAIQENKNYYEAWINKALVLRGLLDHSGSELAFDKAMRILKNTIKLSKNYSVAYYHMGLIHFDRQDYKSAIYCFNKAAQSKEYYEDAEINRGLSLFSLKKYDEAIDVFDQIIDTKINNKELIVASLNNKGITLLCQGKNELAHENFTRAERLDKRNPDSKNNIGLVNYYKKRYKLALESFEEAIDIGKEYKKPSADALNNKGILLFKMERVEESKKALDEAISISPEYSSVRKNKGLILCKIGEHKEALKAFEEALRIRPKEGKIHALMAGSLLKLGDIQRADEEIEKAFRDSKMSLHEKSNAYNIKGQIEIEKLNYDSAIDSFEKAIYFNSSNLSLLVWSAYAKYLKVEFLICKDQNQNQNPNKNEDLDPKKTNSINKKTNPINKKYQEGIVSIIRDLEKISIEFDKKQKSISLPLLILLKRQTLMKMLERLDLFIYGEYDSTEPKKIRRFIKNYKGSINLSIMEHEYEKITEERMIEAYIFYFTGYLYYKIDNLHSALNRLKKCVNKKCGPNIDEPTKNLIQDIWEYKIRPPFWRWWLYSPINKWRKRAIFGITSISFLCMLFPSLTHSLVFFLIDLLTSFLPVSKDLVQNLNSLNYIFFSSITNNTQYIILIILLFILLFPSIQHIKSKDFEVDLNNSPVPFVDFCPLTPDFTPEKSTTLIHIKKRPKPLEIHEIRDQISLDE